MSTLTVHLKKSVDDSYPIVIERGIFEKIAEDIKTSKLGQRIAIITDLTVEKIAGTTLLAQCLEQGLDASVFAFQAGEGRKNIETYHDLCQELYQAGIDRQSLIVALGGGVVGDMAGFVASTYMRGIPFVQIPTTLMAMVDSSIGGKTGIDLAGAKNIVGTFYQPKKIYIDVTLLKTLMKVEIQSGLAEAVKHAIIQDPELFVFLEEHYLTLLHHDLDDLEQVVTMSVALKARVVEQDEKEQGYRRVLNFGHTIGHAVEAAMGLGGITHGGAVSLGMMYEGMIATNERLWKSVEWRRMKTLLDKIGLPTVLPDSLDVDQLLPLMMKDKKTVDDELWMVLPHKIGAVEIKKVPVELVQKVLVKTLNQST